MSASFVAALGLAAGLAATCARADNLLGVYVGAGVGVAQIGNNNGYYDPSGYGGDYHDHDAAWKVIVGLRPVPFVGAELEYIDFGNARGDSAYYGGSYDFGVSAHPRATVLYGLGYLPLPLPFIDVYGKLGVARLQTDNSFGYNACPLPVVTAVSSSCVLVSRFDQQNSRFAYGVGVQTKFQDFAFRGEYERISSTFGDPNALTFSVTWTF
jgi:opacity protein-like surface antigen